MRNKFLFSIVGAAILGIATLCYAQYQTKVYHEQGGDRLVIASGGEIDILSGGALKVAGTDRTSQLDKAVIAGTAGKKIVGAQVSIGATGSSTVSTGLTTVDYAIASIVTVDADHGQVSASWSAGNVILKVYPPGSTTVSSSAGTVTYFAVGTP